MLTKIAAIILISLLTIGGLAACGTVGTIARCAVLDNTSNPCN
jgi:hypothetical protein